MQIISKITSCYGIFVNMNPALLRAFAAVDRALEALDRNAGVKIVADWRVLQL